MYIYKPTRKQPVYDAMTERVTHTTSTTYYSTLYYASRRSE